MPSPPSAWCINATHLKGLLCLLEEYNHLWLSELQTMLCGHLAAWNEMEICREQSLKKKGAANVFSEPHLWSTLTGGNVVRL